VQVYAHKVRHLKYETDVDVTKVRHDTEAVLTANHAAYRAKVERAEKGKVRLGHQNDLHGREECACISNNAP
jgi:hypothetical protein